MLKIKIFADGADKEGMVAMYNKEYIDGFTTNPTLMKKAGITNYKEFALDVLSTIKDKPISFEVFSDEFDEMEKQAEEISSWGENVFVKIPVMNTKSEPSYNLISKLSNKNIKLNITAVMTNEQTNEIKNSIKNGVEAVISIFAGRIADTGVDPVPVMTEALNIISDKPKIELLWASPREVLNIYQANDIGCHIITVTNDLLKKMELKNKNLFEYSRETVEMFYNDAQLAGYKL